MIVFECQGQTLRLYPEKALYWEDRQTLIITDPHFGKAAFFRRKGIPVPRGTTDTDLERLATLIERTRAKRLLILGDFFHAKLGRARRTLAALKAWRNRHPAIDIVLIRGNHDRHAGDPPRSWKFRCLPEGFIDPPFIFCHEPVSTAGGYVLAGHVHPAIILQDTDGSTLRFPCFSFGPESAMLPSFGTFTGSWTITPGATDRVFLVGPDAVVEA